MNEVMKKVAEDKRRNAALIAERGVGYLVGGRTPFAKAIASNNKAAAPEIIQPKVKPGYDAMKIAGEISGTSCIGYVYVVLKHVYGLLGRANEWTALEKCGRAWDSDGLHFQQALIKNGWPSPSLAWVSDTEKP